MTNAVKHTKPRLIEITAGGTDYTKLVNTWKEENGIKFVLAFSGGADDDMPALRHLNARITDAIMGEEDRKTALDLVKSTNDEIIAGIVREVLAPLRGYRIAIQTGGTQFGVSKVATQVAKELKFKTIGVFPRRALTGKTRHALPDNLIDLAE